MAVSLVPVSVFEQLTFLTIIVINVICAVYLVRRYLEKREKLTWLFITFFAALAVCFLINFLIVTDILFLDFTVALTYTYLIGATIVAVIGLAMLGIKQLYALPPLLTVLAYIHQTLIDSSRTQTMILIQTFSYISTRHFIGNPWFITLKALYPNFVAPGLQISMILNLFLDPLAVTRPMVLGLYLALLVFPTTVLFYVLAWKNRSGRSLGFSLGLTANILVGVLTLTSDAPRDLSTVLMLVSALFFALGIFGVFDKLMKREQKKSR